jgi:inhibitor of KinA sporulation pathway (predicted exonuclease)
MREYTNYLLIDFEATCCDKKTIKPESMEIIEFGAVIVSGLDLEIKSEFQSFVKPVRYPKLTEFCKSLTSITQKDVDSADVFSIVVKNFKNWLYQYPDFIFGSWGDFDLKQLHQDCQYHNVPYPISAPHVNVKKLFSESQKLQKKQGLSDAVKLAGFEFTGIHHRGIDDARNIAKLMPYILGRKKIVN